MNFGNNGNNMYMPVVPAGYGYGNGMGNFGGDGGFLWLILFFALFGGMWGGNGMMGGMGLYPWMNQADITTNGFQNQALNTAVAGVQNAVNNGFANAEVANCGRAADAMQTAYQNQIADMERSYNAQTANAQSFNALQAQLAQCCCDNRLATCQTQNIVQTEAAATRASASADNQRVMDKLCQLELDGVKNQYAQAQREILNLQNQLNMATFRESQTAQNALFQQGMNNEVDALYNRLSNCPVPTTPVYGRTPIFTCNNNNTGCGCGNGIAA